MDQLYTQNHNKYAPGLFMLHHAVRIVLPLTNMSCMKQGFTGLSIDQKGQHINPRLSYEPRVFFLRKSTMILNLDYRRNN